MMWYIDPMMEYDLRKSAYTGMKPSWKSRDEFVREAWIELVEENKNLRNQIKELKEELNKYKEMR